MTRRILFLTQTHNVWGGMEQWLHNFTEWLQSSTSWSVEVGLAQGARYNDPAAYLAAHPHVRPRILDAHVGTESARVTAIEQALFAADPDLVVSIGLGAVFPAVARVKRRSSRVRFVVPVRSLAPGLFANVCEYSPIVDCVVSVSRLAEQFLINRFPGGSDRIRYVRHGASPSHMVRDPSRIAAPELPLRVGFVGRLDSEVKRVLDLIPLAEALERLRTPVELHVFGDGPQELALRRGLARAHPRVTFHGHLPQPRLYAEAYPKLDVIILFSITEGSPNAILEAMQHGVVPVISRYVGQAGEGLVLHGRNGYLYDVGAIEDAARGIDRLARNRPLLERMATAALAEVARDTDVRMHRDWLEIFEASMDREPVRAELGRLGAIGTGGRLDRLLPAHVADRLRAVLSRRYSHADGWAEWPGTQPVPLEREEEIRLALEAMDRAQRADCDRDSHGGTA
jgi:glycosyltransferase involved in cell wall biosynthesis